MFMKNESNSNKEQDFEMMNLQLEALLKDEKNKLANLSNATALLNSYLIDINWVGFYILDDKDILVLGPFQGLPACTRINIGKGVCGHAALTKKTIVVPDVHQFVGHIACDTNSNSEIVIPILKDNNLVGVLDIDSPLINRFDEIDQHYLEIAAKIITKYGF